MRSCRIVWIVVAVFGLLACTSGDDGSGQAGEVAEFSSDTYAFEYPTSWSVVEPSEEDRSLEARYEVARLELVAEDGGDAAWLTALYNTGVPTVDAALNVLGADPDRPEIVEWEQVERDLEGADRAVLQRFVVVDQFDDGYDYHYRFVAAEPSAGGGPFVMTVGVREDAPITIEQVERIVVDSLRLVAPEPQADAGEDDDVDVGDDGLVERRLFGDRFAVVVPADWGERGPGSRVVFAPGEDGADLDTGGPAVMIIASDDGPGRFEEQLAEMDPAALAALPDELFGDALDDATLTEFEMDGAEEAWELDGGPFPDVTTMILARDGDGLIVSVTAAGFTGSIEDGIWTPDIDTFVGSVRFLQGSERG